MKKVMMRQKRRNIAGYIFLTPFLIGLFTFTVYPFLSSLYLSFTDYNMLESAKWIGVENYIKMFTADDRFWLSFKVTLKYAIIQVPLKMAVSLIVAVVLAWTTKLTRLYRAIFYIPSLIGGGVAMAITWKQLWGPRGVVNSLLEKVGLQGRNWLYEPNTALYLLILLAVWQFGSQMIIFLAAIKDVPVSLHEAAIMDGAGTVKRFFKITLPMITASTFFNLVNGIIGSLQAFNSAFLITEGGPLDSTLYYGLYQYRQAFEFRHMGYASAMAWFLMLVIVTLTALVFRHSSSWVYYQDEM